LKKLTFHCAEDNLSNEKTFDYKYEDNKLADEDTVDDDLEDGNVLNEESFDNECEDGNMSDEGHFSDDHEEKFNSFIIKKRYFQRKIVPIMNLMKTY